MGDIGFGDLMELSCDSGDRMPRRFRRTLEHARAAQIVTRFRERGIELTGPSDDPKVWERLAAACASEAKRLRNRRNGARPVRNGRPRGRPRGIDPVVLYWALEAVEERRKGHRSEPIIESCREVVDTVWGDRLGPVKSGQRQRERNRLATILHDNRYQQLKRARSGRRIADLFAAR